MHTYYIFRKKYKGLWYQISIIRLIIEYIFIRCVFYVIDVVIIFYKVSQILKKLISTDFMN